MRSSRHGIALVSAAALLGLLVLLTAAFVQAVRWEGSAAGARRGAQAARLSAESGLGYAAARLWEDPRSTPDKGLLLRPENARDDWTARGKEPPDTPPSRLLNPSYARGEPWRDIDADGAYTQADASTVKDADGNGRFTVRSGRLRGGPEFALRIATASALASINSGELGAPTGDHDLDGILNRDDPDYRADLDDGYADHDMDGVVNMQDADFPGPWGNGVPDWRDPDFFGNRHLVAFLNNLGAILEVESTRTVDYAPGVPQLGTMTTSDLGTAIVAARPRGGYDGVDDLAAVLPPSDFEKASPFLSSAREDVVPVPIWTPVNLFGDPHNALFQQAGKLPDRRHAFMARLDFNRAPPELLRAALRHLTAAGCYATPVPPVPGKIALEYPFVRLGEVEADAVAQALAAARPIRTWKRFLETLDGPAVSAAWQDDLFTADDDRFSERRLLKQDLVMALAAPWHLHDPLSWSACTLEVPRGTSLVPGAPAPPVIRRVLKRNLAGPFNAMPYDQAGVPLPMQDKTAVPAWEGSYQTLEWSLESFMPGAFRIDADGLLPPSGAAARVSGELSTGSVLRLASQQDFEMFSTPDRPELRLLDPGHPWFKEGGAVRAEEPCPPASGIRSGPRFPFSSYDPLALGAYPGLQHWIPANFQYPRATGFLQLAPRQWTAKELGYGDPLGPRTAVPFNEDQPESPGVPEPGTWYDAADWRDNLQDPILDPAGAPRGPPATPIGGGTVLSAPYALHQGLGITSHGIRLPAASGVFGGNSCFVWNAGSVPFPMPREDYPGGPPGGGKIRAGTITCWMHACRAATSAAGPAAQYGRVLDLEYLSQDGAFATLLTVRFDAVDTVHVTTFDPAAGVYGIQQVTVPWKLDVSSPLAAAGWHHVAILLDGAATGADPDACRVTLWIDGEEIGQSFSARFAVPPGPPAMRMRDAPVLLPDDTFFYDRLLSAGEIRKQAAEARFAPTGTCLSPRFLFDEALFTKGAVLRGASWDGFVPAQTGGKIQVGLVGYDGSGNPVGSAMGPAWDGTGDPFFACDLRGARSVAFTATITTAPTLLLDDGTGTEVPALRDTPRLSSVTVRYAAHPRWAGLAGR